MEVCLRYLQGVFQVRENYGNLAMDVERQLTLPMQIFPYCRESLARDRQAKDSLLAFLKAL
jgi:hypothetical protein